MDVALILAAFVSGFLAARIGVPPLVGYLGAGFVLHALGYETTSAIESIADFGVLLDPSVGDREAVDIGKPTNSSDIAIGSDDRGTPGSRRR